MTEDALAEDIQSRFDAEAKKIWKAGEARKATIFASIPKIVPAKKKALKVMLSEDEWEVSAKIRAGHRV